MLPVAEEIVYEMNQLGGDAEVMQLLDHQVPVDGIKIQAEIHKEYLDKVDWGLQMLEKKVQQTGYSILSAPINLVGKLEGGKLELIDHIEGLDREWHD